jgi:hypothetical protein
VASLRTRSARPSGFAICHLVVAAFDETPGRQRHGRDDVGPVRCVQHIVREAGEPLRELVGQHEPGAKLQAHSERIERRAIVSQCKGGRERRRGGDTIRTPITGAPVTSRTG